jgi:outer membrane protein with beta-barrel domain
MTRVNRLLVVAVFVGVALAPESANADSFVIPWVGGNAGSRSAAGLIDLGASVGATAASVVDVDLDVSYSPDFFGNGLNSYVLTTMGNVTVGIPFGGTHAPRIRPYLTGGVGLIRARIEDTRFSYSVAHNDVGVNFGGGVTGFLAAHLGVRADLRYIRSLEDNNSTNPFTQVDLGGFHYWRTSIGVVLR